MGQPSNRSQLISNCKAENRPLPIDDGSVTAIHCPGHSPGSVVYTTKIDGELILFGQDIHGPTPL